MDSLLVSVPEAARLLNISRSKTYQLVAEGEIPALHIGRSTRIRRQDLTVWIGLQFGDSAAGRGSPDQPAWGRA